MGEDLRTAVLGLNSGEAERLVVAEECNSGATREALASKSAEALVLSCVLEVDGWMREDTLKLPLVRAVLEMGGERSTSCWGGRKV